MSTIDLSFMDGVQYAERGIITQADLVTSTADGVDLNDLRNEFQEAIDLVNKDRLAIAELFTFNTTNAVDYLVSGSTGVEFEEATEFGEPGSGRPSEPVGDPLGYPFKWWDSAKRYTWRFLQDATAEDLRHIHNAFLDADNRNQYRHIMNALFGNTNRTYQGVPVYSLYNGTDGKTPPTFAGTSFDSGHSHYLVSGAAVIDPTDVETLIETVEEHGHGRVVGDTMVILASKTEAKVISTFRAGSNGASYDFVASDTSIPYLTTQTLVGSRPGGSFHGLKVIGSYGGALIVEDFHVPAGYVVSLASAGPGSGRNPLAFREHPRAELRGLVQIPGDNARYPLVDSYLSRGFGVGVRHRGAAAVMQVKATGSYVPPTLVF
ncbi:hypothetical protein [Pseudactinotalea sp.]|uniref:hypothetical protein n=1 Tax=Pseudactinotalea sp. TaxID=1926260 RepID=UPI003B3AAF12